MLLHTDSLLPWVGFGLGLLSVLCFPGDGDSLPRRINPRKGMLRYERNVLTAFWGAVGIKPDRDVRGCVF